MSGLAEELTELGDDAEQVSSPSGLGPRYAQHEDYDLQVTTPDGRILVSWRSIGGRETAVRPFETLPESNALFHSRGRRARSPARCHPTYVGLARSARDPGGDIARALRPCIEAASCRSLITGATAVACSLGIGYLLARKALAPVDRMVAAAAEITATRLDRRLEITRADDELGRWAGHSTT